MSDKCINWLRFEAIRETVKEHNEKWGPRDDSFTYDLSEYNMTQNCISCNMRPEMPGSLNAFSQVINLFKDKTLVALENAGMKRLCYKSEDDKGKME